MSRTDKDRPLWVKNTDETLPLVAYHEHLYRKERDGRYRRTSADECTLLSPVEQREAQGEYGERYCWTECEWRVDWWAPGGGGLRNDSPPRWYVKHQWHGPERTRSRNILREAAKEYNARGWEADDDDVFDCDFPNYQHRHRASWFWSW